ncbi:TPA: helix-turn-helix domain-containing protein [Enterococcus faecalis]|nr:helix-turn-helix domain-containing protein [Enterococcus faecalis]HBI2020646.1 helix-turn-helix domain-containing protein [Enterococcus faecalis]
MERAFKGIWIPKNVWLDKELSWTEKFLIVEIDSLDNDDGCFASNEYFSNFFGLSKDRVSKLISGLKEKGYIDVSYQYKPGTKSIERRVVKITEGYRRKQLEGIGENNYRGIGENAKDNNTLFNNTENNTKNKKNSVEPSSTMSELFEKIWQTYPKKTNKKKAKEQFLKKIKSDEDFERFKTGYKAYLKYIKLNDWYHPQELFRWIRDERFNDEYDLSETTTQARYTNPPVRQEQLPDWVNEPKQEEEKLSPEEQAELDRQIKDFLEGK